MTSEALIVDVSQDWAHACDVQQRFMQGLDPAIKTSDYSAKWPAGPGVGWGLL